MQSQRFYLVTGPFARELRPNEEPIFEAILITSTSAKAAAWDIYLGIADL